jgi:hypothetical protein
VHDLAQKPGAALRILEESRSLTFRHLLHQRGGSVSICSSVTRSTPRIVIWSPL